jgi:hypothetical protein
VAATSGAVTRYRFLSCQYHAQAVLFSQEESQQWTTQANAVSTITGHLGVPRFVGTRNALVQYCTGALGKHTLDKTLRAGPSHDTPLDVAQQSSPSSKTGTDTSAAQRTRWCQSSSSALPAGSLGSERPWPPWHACHTHTPLRLPQPIVETLQAGKKNRQGCKGRLK